MIGRKLLHYEITEPLGKGGMGEVFRARDTKLDRDVALTAFEQSLADRSPSLAYVPLLPPIFSDELAAEPRFQLVMKGVGWE